MNPGIFISYSRDDEKQAKHLLDMLRREGYSVWIDQEAIAGASIWSDEIVENIKKSDIFIALISEASVHSPNVGKEIALAAEHRKIILPIEIGAVTLPGRLEYALAGIQKTDYHNEAAILHAIRNQIAKLDGGETIAELPSRRRNRRMWIAMSALAVLLIAVGIWFGLRGAHGYTIDENDVIVLPFATLNVDQDSTRNLDIFSDAILTRLATVPEVKTLGPSVTASFRDSRLNAMAIAKELGVRFVVEGNVRKQHDVNFISYRIFDVKRGGQVWEEAYRANSRDLFTTREKIANETTGFLHGYAESENAIKKAEADLVAHPNDADANANLARMLIGTDKTRSLELFDRAIKIDPTRISYYMSAGIVAARDHNDSRARIYGAGATELCSKLLRQHPDSLGLVVNYVVALDMSGHSPRAEAMFDSLFRLYPTDVRIGYNFACCLAKQAKVERALAVLADLFSFAPGKKNEAIEDPDFDNIRSAPDFQKLVYGTGQ